MCSSSGVHTCAASKEFRNQYPAYAADIAGETQKTLKALQTDPAHRSPTVWHLP
ncbi:MAG: hypothetical protein QOI16_4618 [Pseudonocardiales bacterium]|jgi:hypothetical protein|nr:hypothetical protein [Pseudonocardiales bacterium]